MNLFTNVTIGTVLVLLSITLSAPELQAADDLMNVTYIANEGYLISSGEHKVLIDALFYGKNMSFCDVPTRDVLEKMESAQKPFDDLDLILVTHRHADHFRSVSVARALQANPNCKLVCPQQAQDKLKSELDNYQSIENQVVVLKPELFGASATNINGIGLNGFRLKHGPYYVTDEKTGEKVDRHRDIENLGYMVEIGSKVIFHTGDATIALNEQAFRNFGKPVDLLFLEHYDRSEKAMDIVANTLKPTAKIFMHLPVKNKTKVVEKIQTDFPDAVIFTKTMEKRTF